MKVSLYQKVQEKKRSFTKLKEEVSSILKERIVLEKVIF
jgi:hypothetical protein